MGFQTQQTSSSGGTIAGSGTTNYVPKFTPNGTTLGNSIIFDNGSAVGVGIALPTARFHVKSAGSVVGTFAYKLDNSSNVALLHVTDAGQILVGNPTDYNVFIGYGSGLNVTPNPGLQQGIQNVALGYNTLASVTLGSDNVAIGKRTLEAVTVGNSNICFGSGAGLAVVNGNGNIYMGYHAGMTNISGSYNIGICDGALVNSTGSNNIALGNLAGQNAAASNVIIGNLAYPSGTGSSNTIIGNGSGYFNTTGSDNVFIGYAAGQHETGSSKLFIDNTARASEADGRVKALIYGVFDAAVANQRLTINGNVGIRGAATSTSPLNISSLPVAAAGLAAGDVWNNGGVLTIV